MNLSTNVTSKNYYISALTTVNELKRLKNTSNKGTTRKLVHFQVFPDSAHQFELERYQGHIKLDDKFPFDGANGRLTHNFHNKTEYQTLE